MDPLDVMKCKALLMLLIAAYDGNESAKNTLNSESYRRFIRKLSEKYGFNSTNTKFRTGRMIPMRGEFRPLGLIVTSPQEAAVETRNLKTWLKDAESVTIVDPYIMHGPKKSKLFSTKEEYCDYVKKLIPKSAKKVTLVGNNYQTPIKNLILKNIKNGREVKFLSTSTIHDRYLIKDNSEGKILGTSLNGFGNKMFTILDLPYEDVKKICNFIHKISQK